MDEKQIADQLYAELKERIDRAAYLGEQASRVVGSTEPWAAAVKQATDEALAGVHGLVGRLTSDDDRTAAVAASDVMGALWPLDRPEDAGEAAWWRTPLGRACARVEGRSDTGAVSFGVAASMLGISKGSVSNMTSDAPGRGQLDKHPDGAVSRASVLARLGRAPKNA